MNKLFKWWTWLMLMCFFLGILSLFLIDLSDLPNSCQSTFHDVSSKDVQGTYDTNLLLRNVDLHSLKDMLQNINDRTKNSSSYVSFKKFNSTKDYENYFIDLIASSEISSGKSLKDKRSVIPFERFTKSMLYSVTSDNFEWHLAELRSVVDNAIDVLNIRSPGMTYNKNDFLEGIFRTEPGLGVTYELIFKDGKNPGEYTNIHLFRPLGPQHLVKIEGTKKIVINIVMPLSGRIERFHLFIEHLVTLIALKDDAIFLTIVYFGQDNLNEIESTVKKHSTFMRLIKLDEPFSRGLGITTGIASLPKDENQLLFFCDVDIFFSENYLERCRIYSKPYKTVYYPIVFSLYNPNITYPMEGKAIPSYYNQFIIGKNNGFWRDFGYGMTCQYKNDFISTGGFNLSLHGWGLEDEMLYKEFVRRKIAIVRAPDPDIFHVWHDKYCDSNLPENQLKACIKSKSRNAAYPSHLAQL